MVAQQQQRPHREDLAVSRPWRRTVHPATPRWRVCVFLSGWKHCVCVSFFFCVLYSVTLTSVVGSRATRRGINMLLDKTVGQPKSFPVLWWIVTRNVSRSFCSIFSSVRGCSVFSVNKCAVVGQFSPVCLGECFFFFSVAKAWLLADYRVRVTWRVDNRVSWVLPGVIQVFGRGTRLCVMWAHLYALFHLQTLSYGCTCHSFCHSGSCLFYSSSTARHFPYTEVSQLVGLV